VTSRPELVVRPDAAAVSEEAANRISAIVRERPNAVLGFATGATMISVYECLAAAYATGAVSFAQASSFNLDEYVGLGPSDPGSFAAFMRLHLEARTDFDPSRMHMPAGTARDMGAEAQRYEAAIEAAGRIDLQLLGLGRNGHVAFNEPGSGRESRTRVVTLAPDTRVANAAAFAGASVPERAVTMGIGTILDARSLLLVAVGRSKATALARMVEGPVGPACPGSWLREHPQFTIVCDEDAASELTVRSAR
jgi:glucosamine-6-phosphate deaminase